MKLNYCSTIEEQTLITINLIKLFFALPMAIDGIYSIGGGFRRFIRLWSHDAEFVFVGVGSYIFAIGDETEKINFSLVGCVRIQKVWSWTNDDTVK